MKRVVTVLALLLVALSLGAAPALAFEERTGTAVTIGPGETIADDAFAAGTTITVSGHVTGNLYAFGQTVLLTNTGQVDGDVIAAAQSVDVAGTIGGSVLTAAQIVHLQPGAHVGGGAVTAGQDVIVAGAITRGLADASTSLQLTGAVGKEVRANVNALTIVPTAKIGGDLIYQSAQQATVPPGVVAGQVHYVPISNEAAAQAQQAAFGFGWFVRLLWLVGSAIAGILLVRLFPRLREATRREMVDHPLSTFVVGIASLILIPIVALVLLITIIGIPLSVVALTGYASFLYVGWLLMAYTLGIVLIGASQRRPVLSLAPEWPLLLGLLIYFLLRLVPYLGGLVALVGLSMGLGSLLVVLGRAISDRRQATVPVVPAVPAAQPDSTAPPVAPVTG